MKQYKHPQIIFVYLDSTDIIVCSDGVRATISGYDKASEDDGGFSQGAPSRKGPWDE
jgi:hypothetical protein